MLPVPPELLTGAFTRARALELGVSPQMLRGKRFVRLYDGVWRHRDHPMTAADRLHAARLALPVDARVTGVTRLQLLGLGVGEGQVGRMGGSIWSDGFSARVAQRAPIDAPACSSMSSTSSRSVTWSTLNPASA